MLRVAADENFDGRVLRALLTRLPGLDAVRVQDSPVAGTTDPEVPCMGCAARPNPTLRILSAAVIETESSFRTPSAQSCQELFCLDPALFMANSFWEYGLSCF